MIPCPVCGKTPVLDVNTLCIGCERVWIRVQLGLLGAGAEDPETMEAKLAPEEREKI